MSLAISLPQHSARASFSLAGSVHLSAPTLAES